ncbi:Bloom syndrome protein homolog [Homalodisca vitripennis]|uniref:Bloom syndrome protein homolog n=1 Tax=Homalodisca vitripennis TaxID=197043 RepID=UPI001EEBA0B5|nr:Bloom syndrome protein homolog [Homalodisca vitripennis]
MVNYCENRSDCRRAIQLQYFGENYRQRCPNNPAVACDNCLSQESYKVEDVTEQCQALVETVQQICTQRQYNNFTINHLADIWKGSKCRKVLDNGHDTLRSFGQLTGWDKVDVCRLINKLVMEDYLAEYLVTSNDNTHSYIRMGPRARELLHGGSRVVFSMREVKAKKSAVNSPAAKNGEESRCPELDAIYERCFSELMDVVTAIAEINEVNTNTIMNIQALKGMSLTLPESREEMLTITGVTQANYEKYGRDLLKITCRYAEEKSKLNFTDITKKKEVSVTLLQKQRGSEKEEEKWKCKGNSCWFIRGTLCGQVQEQWKEEIQVFSGERRGQG